MAVKGKVRISEMKQKKNILCFSGDGPEEMADNFSYELVLDFHYMYYDFSVFRLEALRE